MIPSPPGGYNGQAGGVAFSTSWGGGRVLEWVVPQHTFQHQGPKMAVIKFALKTDQGDVPALRCPRAQGTPGVGKKKPDPRHLFIGGISNYSLSPAPQVPPTVAGSKPSPSPPSTETELLQQLEHIQQQCEKLFIGAPV